MSTVPDDVIRRVAAANAVKWRETLDLLADEMCPNCLTPWKCNGPHGDELTWDDELELARQADQERGYDQPLDVRKEAFDLADERADVLRRFTDELAKATGDGSRKRQAGTKPPWYEDDAHEVALFSHLAKWKRGEIVDPDSGAHTLVHLAWRALAIACRESGNTP